MSQQEYSHVLFAHPTSPPDSKQTDPVSVHLPNVPIRQIPVAIRHSPYIMSPTSSDKNLTNEVKKEIFSNQINVYNHSKLKGENIYTIDKSININCPKVFIDHDSLYPPRELCVSRRILEEESKILNPQFMLNNIFKNLPSEQFKNLHLFHFNMDSVVFNQTVDMSSLLNVPASAVIGLSENEMIHWYIGNVVSSENNNGFHTVEVTGEEFTVHRLFIYFIYEDFSIFLLRILLAYWLRQHAHSYFKFAKVIHSLPNDTNEIPALILSQLQSILKNRLSTLSFIDVQKHLVMLRDDSYKHLLSNVKSGSMSARSSTTPTNRSGGSVLTKASITGTGSMTNIALPSSFNALSRTVISKIKKPLEDLSVSHSKRIYHNTNKSLFCRNALKQLSTSFVGQSYPRRSVLLRGESSVEYTKKPENSVENTKSQTSEIFNVIRSLTEQYAFKVPQYDFNDVFYEISLIDHDWSMYYRDKINKWLSICMDILKTTSTPESMNFGKCQNISEIESTDFTSHFPLSIESPTHISDLIQKISFNFDPHFLKNLKIINKSLKIHTSEVIDKTTISDKISNLNFVSLLNHSVIVNCLIELNKVTIKHQSKFQSILDSNSLIFSRSSILPSTDSVKVALRGLRHNLNVCQSAYVNEIVTTISTLLANEGGWFNLSESVMSSYELSKIKRLLRRCLSVQTNVAIENASYFIQKTISNFSLIKKYNDNNLLNICDFETTCARPLGSPSFIPMEYLKEIPEGLDFYKSRQITQSLPVLEVSLRLKQQQQQQSSSESHLAECVISPDPITIISTFTSEYIQMFRNDVYSVTRLDPMIMTNLYKPAERLRSVCLFSLCQPKRENSIEFYIESYIKSIYSIDIELTEEIASSCLNLFKEDFILSNVKNLSSNYNIRSSIVRKHEGRPSLTSSESESTKSALNQPRDHSPTLARRSSDIEINRVVYSTQYFDRIYAEREIEYDIDSQFLFDLIVDYEYKKNNIGQMINDELSRNSKTKVFIDEFSSLFLRVSTNEIKSQMIKAYQGIIDAITTGLIERVVLYSSTILSLDTFTKHYTESVPVTSTADVLNIFTFIQLYSDNFVLLIKKYQKKMEEIISFLTDHFLLKTANFSYSLYEQRCQSLFAGKRVNEKSLEKIKNLPIQNFIGETRELINSTEEEIQQLHIDIKSVLFNGNDSIFILPLFKEFLTEMLKLKTSQEVYDFINIREANTSSQYISQARLKIELIDSIFQELKIKNQMVDEDLHNFTQIDKFIRDEGSVLPLVENYEGSHFERTVDFKNISNFWLNLKLAFESVLIYCSGFFEENAPKLSSEVMAHIVPNSDEFFTSINELKLLARDEDVNVDMSEILEILTNFSPPSNSEE